MKTNNFDNVSFIYDILVRFVFGHAMQNAQTFFLDKIEDGSKILILGGGTGWILKSLPSNSEVWYVDISTKMIQKAKQHKLKCKVHFVEGTEDTIKDHQFDVIVTNFYLDLFTTEKAFTIVGKIKRLTKPDSTWIATDFVENKWLHKMLLTIMFAFFRLISNIESKMLPDWQGALQRNGFVMQKSETFYFDFIKTVQYSR